MPSLLQKTIRVVACVGLALALTACGVKGPLEPPPGEVNEAGPQDQSGHEPHREFILDGLL